MPEGDTIWKTATTLERALAGRALIAFEATVALRRRPPVGITVRDVEARGKHLLIWFDDDTALHTHMQMNGSWHVYRSGDRWQRPTGAMRVRVVTREVEAVCFSAPVVEMLTDAEVRRHPRLSQLGPDLTSPAPDTAAAARRLAGLGPREIGVALLDQRVAAGIGNVYKSEVLFACGVNPFAPVSSLGDETRVELLRTAARHLRANVERTGRRSTTRSGGLAVYGRRGSPCRRCGTRIVSARQGEQARVTYWCPTCQPSTRAQRVPS
ncbi:MAG TPA: DNA-formamidopyrimidine glycosylase family protein [Actinomycetota bacterium]|jgi:endonuclease-8|nr:DNA-formamidopyrimidine glycosylase family protein [Actinomycetota bacterium]